LKTKMILGQARLSLVKIKNKYPASFENLLG